VARRASLRRARRPGVVAACPRRGTLTPPARRRWPYRARCGPRNLARSFARKSLCASASRRRSRFARIASA
jgi:hypothetical protein